MSISVMYNEGKLKTYANSGSEGLVDVPEEFLDTSPYVFRRTPTKILPPLHKYVPGKNTPAPLVDLDVLPQVNKDVSQYFEDMYELDRKNMPITTFNPIQDQVNILNHIDNFDKANTQILKDRFDGTVVTKNLFPVATHPLTKIVAGYSDNER